MSVDKGDGYHDDTEIYYPGHEMSYTLEDGTSSCEAFRFRQYKAWEAGGRILLQRASDKTG